MNTETIFDLPGETLGQLLIRAKGLAHSKLHIKFGWAAQDLSSVFMFTIAENTDIDKILEVASANRANGILTAGPAPFDEN